MKKQLTVLRQAGLVARTVEMIDGTRLLILPHGGRLLGLYAPKRAKNFYWINPLLSTVSTTRAFFASKEWHNSGGDRTWLAPEVDIFLPEFPALTRYVQPRELDPGRYRVVPTRGGFKIENELTLRLARTDEKMRLKLAKWFGPALNPLRGERGIDLRKVDYAGYTQSVSLEIVKKDRLQPSPVGLWHLIQMPLGGELLIPTFSRTEPRNIFSTKGVIAARDLLVEDRMVRYRMRQPGEHKISLRAASVCGRVAYLSSTGNVWSLVVRNFGINPSGEYVDVPWNEPERTGFAVQACNVNTRAAKFAELEYHTPAIGGKTGLVRTDDVSQVWAFRGPRGVIMKIAQVLVGYHPHRPTRRLSRSSIRR